jgi:enterochelin esterase family protein
VTRRPAWLDRDAPEGVREQLDIRRGLGGVLWSPAGLAPDDELPLLIALDGPEYAERAGLLRFCATAVASRRLPPFRCFLLPPPGDRDELYSASARHARIVADEVLPALPSPRERRLRACMGASLGGLASFHVHRVRPETFGSLFLQSGSFFRTRDVHERSFRRFGRISRFVGGVLRGRLPPEPIPVTLTCGRAEENLPANRALFGALDAQGYDVRLQVVRGAHDWPAWRSSFDPHLLDLLRSTWDPAAFGDGSVG